MKTSSYIRVVSNDIINYLISHGYTGAVTEIDETDNWDNYGIATSVIKSNGSITECRYTIIPQTSFDSTNSHVTWNICGRVDCGTDIEKFKQLCISYI